MCVQPKELSQNEQSENSTDKVQNPKLKDNQEKLEKLKVSEYDANTLGMYLNIVKDEFSRIEDRYKTIDGRVSIFITMQAGLLAFIAQSAINDSVKLDFLSKQEFFINVLHLILPIITIILLFISIFFFLRILSLKAYQHLDLEPFKLIKSYDIKRVDYAQACLGLIQSYATNAIVNRKVNEEKQGYYKIAVWFTASAIICLMIWYITKYFI